MKPLKVTQRSNTKIACRVLKGIGSIFTIAKNSVYETPDLTESLIRICIQNDSAEQCSNTSPDVVLRRFHQADEQGFARMWRRINAGLLRKLNFQQRVLMALDFRTLPYYGTTSRRLSAIHGSPEPSLA